MAPIIPANDSTPKPAATGDVEPSFVPFSGLGAGLRQARQAKNKTIEEAADRLRIKAAFLEALEDGDEESLPGHVYALGFVRSYAEFLEMDPEQAVQDFKREAENHAHHTELSFPAPPTPRPSSGMPLMVVLGALGLAVLAGWFVTKSNTLLVADGIPTPPGLSNAGLTVAEAPPITAPTVQEAAPHIATALFDIARTESRPTQPPIAAPLPLQPSALLQPALPSPIANAPTISKPIPWPAYVLPLDMVRDLNIQAEAARTPPPKPMRRPEQEIAAATSKKQQQQFAQAATDLAVPPGPPSAPSAEVAIALAEEAAGELAITVGASTQAVVAPSSEDIAAAAETVTTEDATRDNVERSHIPSIPASVADTGTNHIYGQANRNARIVIAAESDIWIQIRDQDQNDLFTRLLHAGDSYRVPNRPGLLLFTGNAGGLKVTVDGQPVAALGITGAVRRDVALNADRLLATSIQ